MFFISRSYVLTRPSRDRPLARRLRSLSAGPDGKQGTEDHGKRAGASTPSRITSSSIETTARANASTAIPPISRASSLAAPSCRRARAPRAIAIAQMMESHRDLDQSLQRLPLAARRAQPVRLQQFMHFEVEASVEQERGLLEGHLERRAGRVQRAPREESARSRRPLGELRGVRLSGAVGGERLELAPRRVVVKGLEDELREPVPLRQRERHGRRSTRVPAMRSCKARLSRRSPAIR